jgi:hypothetical protein
MQRQLLESESGASVKKKLKRPSGNQSYEESDDEEDSIFSFISCHVSAPCGKKFYILALYHVINNTCI